MGTEIEIALIALASALLHASWNALVKARGDRLLNIFATVALGGALSLPIALLLPAPDAASLPFLAASSVVHVGYFLSLAGAYRDGDLSQVYPLSRAIGLVAVTLAAAAVAGEALSVRDIGAIVAIAIAIAGLALAPSGDASPSRRAVLFAAATGGFICAYMMIDGLGVRRSGAPIAYALWLALAMPITLAPVVLIARRGRILAHLRQHWRRAGASGMVAIVSYGLILWALTLGTFAHVMALREASVLFAAVMGTLVLREPFGLRRVAAAAAIVAGLIVLSLPG